MHGYTVFSYSVFPLLSVVQCGLQLQALLALPLVTVLYTMQTNQNIRDPVFDESLSESLRKRTSVVYSICVCSF